MTLLDEVLAQPVRPIAIPDDPDFEVKPAKADARVADDEEEHNLGDHTFVTRYGDNFLLRWENKRVIVTEREVAEFARFAGLLNKERLLRSRIDSLRFVLGSILKSNSDRAAVCAMAENGLRSDGQKE